MTEKVINLPMSCVCGEEGQIRASQAREEARHLAYDTNDKMFVSNVIMALWHDYYATLEGVWSDMWFLVSVKREDVAISIACDTVEDGLAEILCYVADTYKKNDD